jgi:hypothetical protein
MHKRAEPSLTAELEPVQETAQGDTYVGKVSDGYFWGGFRKKAAYRVALGEKAMSHTTGGSLKGLSPKTGVATAAAFKPNPLPTPKPMAADKTLAPAPTLGGLGKAPRQPRQGGMGVAKMVV